MDTKSVIGRRRSSARKEARASYENRKAEISEAAVRVFHRLGYQGASLSAVAAEIGVDRATIYYYFSSKEDMFDEVVRSVLEENERLAKRIAGSDISPRRKMRELLMAFMTSYVDNYPLLHIYVREDLTKVQGKRSDWSLHMRNLNRNIENCFVEIIEQGYADGSFRRMGAARTVTYGILGMLNWSHRWFNPNRSGGAEEIGNTFAELVLGGLESPY
ncbi:TetR/AcrR family transcriptional regulator [Tsuneonella sp. CC-YZS046]|uniref:TetR/AcrR family transcriptional regulator n=1 Tax=Tsuneonella sp. CC-YZS046 TaxID=3042152 RepID=UPI002D78D2F8|nr:TetR/AcrR family transcriptional regulator [Tsuneonella sp. CC-YZS046]WRO66715.1 TetR/AcrR family transcriptional regulator [Tsuneonella sp. CC-YZS046]